MRNWDIEALYSFVLRPNMYLRETSPKNISLYLAGYEIGSKYECDFTSKVKAKLIDKFGFSENVALEDILGDLALINKNWISVFQEVSKDILIQESDRDGQEVYRSILRDKLLNFLEVIPTNVDTLWTLNFYQNIRYVNEWEGKSFNVGLLDLLKELEVIVGENLSKRTADSFPISRPMTEILSKIKEELSKNA